jgi:hypothetical protein
MIELIIFCVVLYYLLEWIICTKKNLDDIKGEHYHSIDEINRPVSIFSDYQLFSKIIILVITVLCAAIIFKIQDSFQIVSYFGILPHFWV